MRRNWNAGIEKRKAENRTVQKVKAHHAQFASINSSRDCSVYHLPEKMLPSAQQALVIHAHATLPAAFLKTRAWILKAELHVA
jgi:hypothetical protein